MSTEDRVSRLENAFKTLAELARKQSERRKYKHNSEKIAGAQKQTQTRFDELAEAQKKTKAHLSVLAQVMTDLGRAQARTEVALTRTEAAVASLTERFEQYISSRP